MLVVNVFLPDIPASNTDALYWKVKANGQGRKGLRAKVLNLSQDKSKVAAAAGNGL